MLVKFDEFGALEITDVAVLDAVAGASRELPPPPSNVVCLGPLVDYVLTVEQYALDTASDAVAYVGDALSELNVYCP